jgi:hypothetical protein
MSPGEISGTCKIRYQNYPESIIFKKTMPPAPLLMLPSARTLLRSSFLLRRWCQCVVPRINPIIPKNMAAVADSRAADTAADTKKKVGRVQATFTLCRLNAWKV